MILYLYCYVDFFTYNDRYDEENYEYDYPEEEGHQIHEEVHKNTILTKKNIFEK